MQLIDLGWNDFFEAQLNSYHEENVIPARVIRENKSNYLLLSERGEQLGTVTGKMLYNRNTEQLPVVGDWVAIDALGDHQTVQIKQLLSRQSAFERKTAGEKTEVQVVAANINTIFIVSGLDDDYNLRRLERYLTTVWDSGAKPVLIFNKVDVCDDIDRVVEEVESIAYGVPYHFVSATNNDNLSSLEPYFEQGTTIALLGSSGVGKSTLINYFIGEEKIKTREVSDEKSKGRHTTSHRELLLLPTGALLMDTPGMRELQLWADESSLKKSFEEIEALSKRCRFADCRHQTEPGCAVKEAIDNGELDNDRLISYHKQLRELEFLNRRKDELGRHEEKKRGKRFASMVKEVKKIKGRYKTN